MAEEEKCPNCGYCPACGRSDEPVECSRPHVDEGTPIPYPIPYPIYPTYPIYPWTAWTVTTTDNEVEIYDQPAN